MKIWKIRKEENQMKKWIALLLVLCMTVGVLAGCGSSTESTTPTAASSTESTTATETIPAAKKTFVFGDTTFNAENEEPNVNPHYAYDEFPFSYQRTCDKKDKNRNGIGLMANKTTITKWRISL